MSTTRLALRQAVAQRVTRFAAGTADSGSTVMLTDAEQLEDSGASAELWEGSWLHVHAGTNAGEIRRVTAYDPAGGSVTVNRAFPSAVDGTSQYELLRLLSPDQVHQAIDDTLARCWYRTMAVVTLVPDGDMEDPTTGSWTPSGATLAKVAANQDPLAGTQALEVTNTGAHGYAASQRVATLEGQRYVLEASVAPGGATAELALRDATFGATLASASATGVAWRPLQVACSIPSGCDELEVRLGGAEADAVTTWDNAILIQPGRRQFPLPAWVTRRQQIVEVWERRSDVPGADVMRAVDWWRVIASPTAAGSPFWLELDGGPSAGAVLALEALRPYAALTDDASTTTVPSDWIVQGAMVEVYRRLKRDSPAGDVARYDALQQEAAREFQQLSRLYQPRAVRRVMLQGGC